MPKRSGRLTALQVDALGPGLHSDGNNLYLRVKPNGRRSWAFIYRSPSTGGQREAGLGKAGKNNVSLADARNRASEGLEMLGRMPPVDPLTAWRAPAPSGVMTFGEAVESYFEMKAGGPRPAWRSAKHAKVWRRSVETYAKSLFKTPIDQIVTNDILRVLRPIWPKIPETGRRLRERLAAVFDYGLPDGKPNPAEWRALAKRLAKPSDLVTEKPFAALPYADIPAFTARLRVHDSVQARALEFLLLTATRTSETVGCRREEIKPDKTWVLPLARLKTAKRRREPFVIPLSERAREIVEEMDRIHSGAFVFPGHRDCKPLGTEALLILLQKRLGYPDLTVHGLRSTFRDWAGDKTDASHETCEAALGHQVGSKVERSYRRGDALEKRRRLMEAWSRYCGAPPDGAPAQASVTDGAKDSAKDGADALDNVLIFPSARAS